MKKYVIYFLYLLKIIIKFNFEFSKPLMKKYLIIDGEKNPLSKIFSKNDYNIFYRRGEKLNLPIILECLLEFKLNSLNYYLKYIKYSKPKVILCFFDFIHMFYILGELTKVKTIMFQYGTRSWDMGILKDKRIYDKKNFKKFYIDYIFVHNKGLKNIYNKFTRGKKIVIGSFQNNFCDLNIKKKKEVLYISSFRRHSKVWEVGDEIIIKSLYKLAKKNKLKFNISGRETDMEADEIKYYSDIIKDNFNYISKKKFMDSYKVMQSYEYTFSAFSTMAKENLARGNRTGIILYKPNSSQSHILRLGYGAFEKLKKKGPFWSNMKKFKYKEVERIFYFVVKSKAIMWKKLKRQYIDPSLEFDHNNKKFFKILKKLDDK